MIEAVVEGFLSTLGELLAYSLWPIFYSTGWLILKLVTFGTYPPKEIKGMFNDRSHSKFFVRFVGFLIWCVIGYIIFISLYK